jgi:hypothetical protein
LRGSQGPWRNAWPIAPPYGAASAIRLLQQSHIATLPAWLGSGLGPWPVARGPWPVARGPWPVARGPEPDPDLTGLGQAHGPAWVRHMGQLGSGTHASMGQAHGPAWVRHSRQLGSGTHASMGQALTPAWVRHSRQLGSGTHASLGQALMPAWVRHSRQLLRPSTLGFVAVQLLGAGTRGRHSGPSLGSL